MHAVTAKLIVALTMAQPLIPTHQIGCNGLLDRYASSADRLGSWRIQYECTQEFVDVADVNAVGITYHTCVLACDGERASWRERRWGGIPGRGDFMPEDNGHYLSILWDGHTYSNYSTRVQSKDGMIILHENPSIDDLNGLRYEVMIAPLLGHYSNSWERIDSILRKAKEISLRDDTEPVNGADCHVIDARTDHGDYSVWLDPEHGYNVAKAQIRATREKGHRFRDRRLPCDEFSCDFVVRDFRQYDGLWVATEGTWELAFCWADGGRRTTRGDVKITELTVAPDHEALGSFVRNDVPNGTHAGVVPHAQIGYVWQDGKPVPKFSEGIVAGIDRLIQTLRMEEGERDPAISHVPVIVVAGGSAESNQGSATRRATYPHCGLYCIYTLLGLADQAVEFRDLVKPEYLGHQKGSSLSELRLAAIEHGLHGELIARLTTRGLRQCPYAGVLHVRVHPESPEYDHYELFLGVEKGMAKLCNPPQMPRLVDFKDLVPLWDGRALFVSDTPVDVAAIMAPDRQRYLLYGMLGVLVVLAVHLAKRLWLFTVGELPRRWFLGLTAGQAAALGLMALLSGGVYHFATEGGLLANAAATASLQKGYAADFIPRISKKKVSGLLNGDTVIVDARLTRDYEGGHLPHAINLPVDANDARWQEILAGIPAGRPLVVYCQSSGCPYAKNVSLRLIEDGYTDISIYKGGWADWSKDSTEFPAKHSFKRK